MRVVGPAISLLHGEICAGYTSTAVVFHVL